MQSSVMPDLSIELEETHNRRLFNRFVAWLCHDTLFWEQKSLANFEFFVPLPHFNGFNGLDYGVSSFWLVLSNKQLSLFRGRTMNFHQTRPKVIEGCLWGKVLHISLTNLGLTYDCAHEFIKVSTSWNKIFEP